MMPPPWVVPWGDTLDVGIDIDIAAEVHVNTYFDFGPTEGSHYGTLYGPGFIHVEGLPTNVDLYARLVSIDGEDRSECTLPVQIIPPA
jgi:hypothetical protein